MVRPHREESFTEELARQALQSDGGGHRGEASSQEEAGAAQQDGGGHRGKGISPKEAGAEKTAPTRAAKTTQNALETSYLSSLAASALEETLKAAEPEPDYQ